ncbi:MAG: sugar ABC transporter substrate-binding protein, partial [Anaerolineae bacterium]|nr:sugar ABC transporter substrate-binding protein [Anaerolineae bacterium]
IEQDIIYGYLANEYLVDMTQALADSPDLAAPGFSFDNFTTFLDYFKNADGDVFGIPMEAFVKIYLYRTDLFDDPDIQAAFEAEYGYPLAPATTHEQYRDIAAFFTAYGEANDMQLWGTTVQAASGHPSSFYEFFESIAPTYGVYNWGINMENWKATVENGGSMNSDAAKEALAWWIGNLEFAPPESTSSTWDEVAASFAAGRAAQGIVYGENAAWIATDPERSNVVGNVGVALPPLSDGILAAAEAGDGYIGYYDGGAFGLPISSLNKEAALLWMQFVGLPEVQAEWAATSSRIVMDATYSDPLVIAVDEATNGYFTLMRDEGYLFAGAPPFPFHPQVREIVAPFIYQAIGGDITAAEALDQAAVAADAELVSLGYGS